MWRLRPAVLLGALWAMVAARLVRRRLTKVGVRAPVPRPPRLGAQGGLGVMAALARLKPTCLERALVLQAWMAAQGTARDVVIGVPRNGMKSGPAHAWVDGMETSSPTTFIELHRIPPTIRN